MANKTNYDSEELGASVTLTDLRQRHIESFAVYIRPFIELPLPRYRGEVVRGAITAGWFVTPEYRVEDVGDFKVPLVRWLSEICGEAYTDATEIDPKS